MVSSNVSTVVEGHPDPIQPKSVAVKFRSGLDGSELCRPWQDVSAATLRDAARWRRSTGGLLGVAADVGFGAHALDHVRVVQFESRPLRPDSGEFVEIVPRRWAAGGPLQRVAVTPRVIDGDRLAVPPPLKHV